MKVTEARLGQQCLHGHGRGLSQCRRCSNEWTRGSQRNLQVSPAALFQTGVALTGRTVGIESWRGAYDGCTANVVVLQDVLSISKHGAPHLMGPERDPSFLETSMYISDLCFDFKS